MNKVGKMFVAIALLASQTAHAQGFLDTGASVFVNGGVSSPGFVLFQGQHFNSGLAVTEFGVSQTFGNFGVSSFASLPTGSVAGQALVFGNVSGGSSAAHGPGFTTGGGTLFSTAGAFAANGGTAQVSVFGTTGGGSFALPFAPATTTTTTVTPPLPPTAP
jgi:hypothetical protein